MAEIFNRGTQQIKSPITADRCTITIDGNVIADAQNFQCSYGQAITKRRAIGNQVAIIYGSMPSGQISISRLVTADSAGLLSSSVFSCKGGTVTFAGTGCDGGSVNYTARGAMVSGINISASADDLTVMDGITIEFIELSEG